MSAFDKASEVALFDSKGSRKYLTSGEADALLAVARKADLQTRLFCKLLYHTGARISEALAITPRHLDSDAGRIILRTLKRRKASYRGVPVPARFMRDLVEFAADLAPDTRLFGWSRQTGWRRIRALMEKAGIEGAQAKPRGLRHRYGCHAIECGLPESLLGRLLGHADNSRSTRIYTFVHGPEERALIRRMWERAPSSKLRAP